MKPSNSSPTHNRNFQDSTQKEHEHEESLRFSDGSSSENVHFLESGSYKYMTGERVSTGIRVDKGLYLRFKTVSKAIYGSTCRAFELYMIALIETAEKGVHFSNTMNRPIQIEKIVIERNLKSRREMVLVEEEETTKTVVAKAEGFCEWEGCENVGVYVCFIRDDIKLYCERHKEFGKSHGLIMGWKRLEAWRL